MLRYGRQAIPLAIAAAAGSGATYYTCHKNYDADMALMTQQINQLQEKERNAVITKRISEQMEDIAYQQKEISDQQKERAEEQSRIADIERGKAEFERVAAQTAEHKAVIAAREADSMRVIAEWQTEIANANAHTAIEARAQADTLFYLSLSRSLAQASLRESAGRTSTDLSRLLSYASWHYAREYGNNAYHQELYQSLIRSSGLLTNNGGIIKGNIRFVKSLDAGGSKVTMAISDYGEIFFAKGEKMRLYANNKYDFRDVVVNGTEVYALTTDGTIMVADIENTLASGAPMTLSTFATMPSAKWSHLALMPETKQLVAISDKHIAWFDTKRGEALQFMDMSHRPTTLGIAGNVLHVFAADGVHYTSTTAGKLQERDLPFLKGDVTAFAYNDEYQHLIAGMSDGSIHLIDNGYNELAVLTGHTSAITHMMVHNNSLLSASYDKTLKFWMTQNILTNIPPYEQKLDLWPLSFDVDKSSHTMWVGTAGGYLINFCIDIELNANANRKMLKREFTDVEWDYYIGPSIPRIKFMNNNKEE